MFFKEIASSVCDFKFYAQVKDFGLGRAFKYLFLFLLVITVALTARYSYMVNYGLGLARSWSEKNLPVIHVDDGVVSADVKQPYQIEVEDGVVIIDTTGAITSLDGYDKGTLLTKHELIFKKNAAESRVYSLREIKSLTIDKQFLEKAKKIIIIAAIPIILIGMYLYFCFARLLQILLFSLIALVIAAIMRTKLTYKQVFNISVYAASASMLLGLVAALLLKPIPYFGWLYNCVYVIYLIFALRQCKTENIQEAGV
ncbi:MAG: DUF1189 domain-containing protein [Candidatus Omnitrophica bacterium]|nr:DUF1189 domain-containing protein [Candidatus Omnitrophota bacterium]